MLSRNQLASRRRMMPGRVSVSVYAIAARDTWGAAVSVKTERRPVTKGKRRTSDGESHEDVYEYVFWTIDLDAASLNLREGDRIGDGSLYVQVDSIKEELQGQRQRVFCSLSIDPATVI